MTRPDLHTHSTFSDGVLSPSLLVEKAVSMGVTVMAVTDHDTFEGCDSLWDAALPIPVIPGVELTNGMRDLFSGDVLAGLLHIGEAVFLATIIALGAVFILSLGGMV